MFSSNTTHSEAFFACSYFVIYKKKKCKTDASKMQVRSNISDNIAHGESLYYNIYNANF